MSRIIINNESFLHDFNAIGLVKDVMDKGLISNQGKKYCYATVFKFKEKEVAVYSSLNKKSHSFKVIDFN